MEPIQQFQTPPQDTQIVQASDNKHLSKVVIVIVIVIMLCLLIGGIGGYFVGLNNDNSLPSYPQNNNPSISLTATKTTLLSPTIFTSTSTPTINSTIWKTQLISLQHESEFLGNKTVTLEAKFPSDWTLETIAQPTGTLIRNCAIYSISNSDKTAIVKIQPICNSWTSKLNNWPLDAVIIKEEMRRGNGGKYNKYLVRYLDTKNIYIYVDASTESEKSLDKNKDLLSELVSVGYQPPNEDTDDFFFVGVKPIFQYTGNSADSEKLLKIADEIVSSLTLR